jgi:hypothetical protein
MPSIVASASIQCPPWIAPSPSPATEHLEMRGPVLPNN